MHGHMSKRRTASLLVALALTAAACGGNKVNNVTGPAETTTSVATRSDANAVTGGEMNIGIEARPKTLDVITASAVNTSSWQYVSDSIYDSLVGRSPVDGKIENRLAEKIVNSADFKTWTITLRKGITFSDGSPLNAQVVVDNFKFRADPKNNCPCIANWTPIHPTVVDEMTVQLVLDQPNAHLPDPRLLAPIMAESLLTPTADRDRKPIGTGPFRLVDRDQLIVEKNPNYWRTDDRGRKLPFLDRIKFVPIEDGTVRVQALLKGELDMLEAYDGATITAAQKESSVTTSISPGAGSTVAILNSTKAPFNDPDARLAVAEAVSREALAQSLPTGGAQPTYSFLGEGSPYKITGTFPKYDPEAAKKLTAKILAAKGKNALDFSLVCVKIPDAEALMPVVINQLKAAGFNPTLRMLDIGEYAQTMLNGNKDFNLACTRATSFAADPSGIATFVRSDGTVNVAGYNNPEMDKLFDQDKLTIDPAERVKIYQKVNDLVIRDLPYIPLLVNTAAIVTRSVTHGLSALDADWAAHVDTAWLWKAKG